MFGAQPQVWDSPTTPLNPNWLLLASWPPYPWMINPPHGPANPPGRHASPLILSNSPHGFTSPLAPTYHSLHPDLLDQVWLPAPAKVYTYCTQFTIVQLKVSHVTVDWGW